MSVEAAAPLQCAEPASSPDERTPRERQVQFEYTPTLPKLLAGLRISLAISTYQAGKLVVVGTIGEAQSLAFHNFDRPMGLAVRPGELAMGTRDAVWFLREAPGLARELEPVGTHNGLFAAVRGQKTSAKRIPEVWVMRRSRRS